MKKKDGACTVGVDKFKNFFDFMAKATIIASKDDKLKKTYIDMHREAAKKIIDTDGTRGAEFAIQVEKLEIEICKAKIEVLEEELKKRGKNG